MTDVSLAPLIDALSPIVVNVGVAVVTAAIPIIGGWVIYILQKISHTKLNEAQLAAYNSAVSTIQSKASTWAGLEIAKDAGNLRGKSIRIDNPAVVAAANSIAADLPQVMKDAGWDTSRIAKLVAGEIGKLQPPLDAPTTTTNVSAPTAEVVSVENKTAPAAVQAPTPVTLPPSKP